MSFPILSPIPSSLKVKNIPKSPFSTLSYMKYLLLLLLLLLLVFYLMLTFPNFTSQLMSRLKTNQSSTNFSFNIALSWAFINASPATAS